MCYDHLNLSAQNLYDRAAKAERGSKTLREYMEEQREQPPGAQNNKKTKKARIDRKFRKVMNFCLFQEPIIMQTKINPQPQGSRPVN